MPRNVEETIDDEQLARSAEPLRAGARRVRWLDLVYRPGDAAIEGSARYPLTGKRVVIGRSPESRGGIEIADGRASREHVELLPQGEGYAFKDLESKNGSFLDGERSAGGPLSHGSVLRVGETVFVYAEATVPEGLRISEARQGVALLRAIAEANAELAGPTRLPLLIIGPTGAGKEVLAQRVHEESGRSGAMVAVNCATLSKELIASELFGHTAGAFSGATRARSGLFVAADGGTLLLDEIGELPLDQQAALLRVLQEGRVRPLGSDEEQAVDVRVVAATLQPLEQLIDAGRFRADLYARLAGFVIELPALAQRREEILTLFRGFLSAPKPLGREAAEALLLYAWPQNVRELRHAAARAELMARDLERIELAFLPESVQQRRPAPEPAPARPQEKDEDEVPTREALEQMLRAAGGNVAEVSRTTGKHRQQIYRWLKRYGLELDQFRPED